MASTSVLSLQFIGALLPSFSDEIMSAVLGASLAFLFSWLLQRRAEKKSRALDLIIKEYSSPEFIDIRNDAGKAIRTAFEEFKKIRIQTNTHHGRHCLISLMMSMEVIVGEKYQR